jgi:uncharacterized membrane protein
MHRYDDDDEFETVIGPDGKPARVLRDGKTIRVPLLMADAARRNTPFLHDGYGGPVGGKPGFIVSDADQAIRDEAYRQFVAELRDAWRPTRDVTRSTEVATISAADALCTNITTLIARLNDARRSAYGAYVDELSNAWRRT